MDSWERARSACAKSTDPRRREMERQIELSLHHCDCEKFMAGLPDKHFDLTIADPPYGIGKDFV